MVTLHKQPTCLFIDFNNRHASC
uniref:Uncharacterized protein n=1 Tax=Arundo donax TaxID=35708 RepID=A0A0A9EB85_ARUDO